MMYIISEKRGQDNSNRRANQLPATAESQLYTAVGYLDSHEIHADFKETCQIQILAQAEIQIAAR